MQESRVRYSRKSAAAQLVSQSNRYSGEEQSAWSAFSLGKHSGSGVMQGLEGTNYLFPLQGCAPSRQLGSLQGTGTEGWGRELGKGRAAIQAGPGVGDVCSDG